MGLYGDGRPWHGVESKKPWKWILIILSWLVAANAVKTGNILLGIFILVGAWFVIKFLL